MLCLAIRQVTDSKVTMTLHLSIPSAYLNDVRLNYRMACKYRHGNIKPYIL